MKALRKFLLRVSGLRTVYNTSAAIKTRRVILLSDTEKFFTTPTDFRCYKVGSHAREAEDVFGQWLWTNRQKRGLFLEVFKKDFEPIKSEFILYFEEKLLFFFK